MAEPGSTEAQEVEAQPSARRTLMTGGDPHTGRHTRAETRLTPVLGYLSRLSQAQAPAVASLRGSHRSEPSRRGGARNGKHTRRETRLRPVVTAAHARTEPDAADAERALVEGDWSGFLPLTERDARRGRHESDTSLGPVVAALHSAIRADSSSSRQPLIRSDSRAGTQTTSETRPIPEVVAEVRVDSSPKPPVSQSERPAATVLVDSYWARPRSKAKPLVRPERPVVTVRVDSYWSRPRSPRPLVLQPEPPAATVPVNSYWSHHFRKDAPK